MINATPQTLKERFFQPPYVCGVAFSLPTRKRANIFRKSDNSRAWLLAALGVHSASVARRRHLVPTGITTSVPHPGQRKKVRHEVCKTLHLFTLTTSLVDTYLLHTPEARILARPMPARPTQFVLSGRPNGALTVRSCQVVGL